jgi:regulator of replication initiation timing
MNITNDEEAQRRMQALSAFDPTTLPGQRETPEQEALRLRAENERLRARLAAATGRLGEVEQENAHLWDALAHVAYGPCSLGQSRNCVEEGYLPGCKCCNIREYLVRLAPRHGQEIALKVLTKYPRMLEEDEYLRRTVDALRATLAPPEKESTP